MNRGLQRWLLAYAVIVVSIGVNASQSKTGQELAREYAARAAAKAKQGYVSSAVSGATEGAPYGAIVGLSAAIARSSQYIPPVSEWGSYLVAPVLTAAAIGGFLGSATSMWNEAFSRNSSPEWIKQMQKLVEPQGAISEDVVLLAGVPTDLVSEEREKRFKTGWVPEMWFTGTSKLVRKTYLVSPIFSNIENADKGDHYEIYLMPKDENLVTVFLNVNDFFQDNRFINKIDFIALRPTPGVTKSPYNTKNMARIIIGFTPQADQEVVAEAMAMIALMAIQGEHVTKLGLGIQPRHSYCPFKNDNNFMYVAYGSADYKDSVKGKEEYAYKAAKLWPWQSLTDEDMAFPSDDKTIKEEQIQRYYNNQVNKFLLQQQELKKQQQELEKLQDRYGRSRNLLIQEVIPPYASDL